MIIFVSGKPRSGKTSLIAMLSQMFMDSGVIANANLPLFETSKGQYINGDWNGPRHENYRPLTMYRLVQLMEKGRVEPNQFLTIHEVHSFMHSHKSMGDIGLFGSIFIGQSAKLGYDWLVDSQITMKVENTFRELADIRLKAERNENEQCFTYHILDTAHPNEDVDTGDSFNIPFSFASLYWDRYDTYESSPPVELEELKANMEKLSPKDKNARINRAVELLLKEGGQYGLNGPGDCSKVAVEDALLQLGAHPAFSLNVAHRLKLKMRSK